MHYAIIRKVVGSIPNGVVGIFHIHILLATLGPGVDSVPNRNVYQEYFLGVKAASVNG
jgi:uncharacterized membrane protein YuzA (DUF378 family)